MYYISLLYLIFPIYYTVIGEYPFYIFLLTVGFAIAYLGIILAEKAHLIYLFWLYMCGYVVYMTFVGHPSFFMYSFFLSNLLTWRFQEDSWGSIRHLCFYLVVCLCLYPVLSYPDIYQRIFGIVMIAICLGMMYSMKQSIKREQLEKQLNEKNASINLLLAENERNRIGQDLHDSLGHVFAMMSIKSELASTLMKKGSYEQAQKEIEDLQTISKTSMQQVRQIVQDLKYCSLEEELQILKGMLDLAGIHVTIRQDIAEIGKEQEISLTMTLRELCNNLIKHSQAGHCSIQLMEKNNTIQAWVEDDGVGFQEIRGDELHSIRERLVRYQGTVTIISAQSPTQICIDIPKGEVHETTCR